MLDGSMVSDVSVADFWREKHDGMEVRWRNEGAWWSGLVLDIKKRKTLSKITALLNHM